MPRPRKQRHICCMPRNNEFMPVSSHGQPEDAVVITVDEYEVIRLIDREGLSQEECSAFMNVARTTAQQIYASARQKIAVAIVEGLRLKIEGGDYCICSGHEARCGHKGCHQSHGDSMCRPIDEEKASL
jgi:uncharacterized protein